MVIATAFPLPLHRAAWRGVNDNMLFAAFPHGCTPTGCKWQHEAPTQIRVGAFYYVPWRELEWNVVIFDVVLTETLPPPFLFVFFAGFGRDCREFEGLSASVRLVVGGLDGNLKFVFPAIHGELHGHLRRILRGFRPNPYFFTADHLHPKISHGNTSLFLRLRADFYEPDNHILDQVGGDGGEFLKS